MTNHWVKNGIFGLHYHPSNPFLSVSWLFSMIPIPCLNFYFYHSSLCAFSLSIHTSHILVIRQYSIILFRQKNYFCVLHSYRLCQLWNVMKIPTSYCIAVFEIVQLCASTTNTDRYCIHTIIQCSWVRGGLVLQVFLSQR